MCLFVSHVVLRELLMSGSVRTKADTVHVQHDGDKRSQYSKLTQHQRTLTNTVCLLTVCN